MMHGHEKSDSVIVAAKPANKAEQSAAEPVEPRAGTKGNASQQSTCVPDAEPGKRVTSAGAHTEDRKGKEEGEVHRALPPSQHRSAGGGVLRAQGRRSTRRGSADMDGL